MNKPASTDWNLMCYGKFSPDRLKDNFTTFGAYVVGRELPPKLEYCTGLYPEVVQYLRDLADVIETTMDGDDDAEAT